MNTLAVSLALLGLLGASLAVQVKIVDIRQRVTETPSLLRQPLADRVQQLLVHDKANNANSANGGSKFHVRSERTYPEGTASHLQQFYNGLRVFGHGVTVFESRPFAVNNAIVAETPQLIINGKIADDFQGLNEIIDKQPVDHTKTRMLRRAKVANFAAMGATNYQLGGDLTDKTETIIYVDPDTKDAQVAILMQYVDKFSDKPSYPNVIMSLSGEVLAQWEGLQTSFAHAHGPGGNEKQGRIERDNIPVTQLGKGVCAFQTDDVVTVDLEHSPLPFKTSPYTFDCFKQTEREVNGGYSSLNDAHFYANKVAEFFRTRYGTTPLKEAPLYVKVHFRRDFENAFWNNEFVTFGDGQNMFYPLTSLDVLAHEINHGVTTQSSGLVYADQSGGLNEAFSDMAGKAIEYFVRGPEGVNFGVGHDITKPALGRPLRCMDNPRCDGMSIDHARQFQRGMSVHLSSGVFNKAFVEMSRKFKNTVVDAFDLFYVANTRYWHETTTFAEAAELMLQATDDLKAGLHLPHDYSHIDTKDIVDAYTTVGISCQKGSSWKCST